MPRAWRWTASRLGRQLRLALIAILVLGLAPLPLATDAALAADPPTQERPIPNAKAVRLLERLQESGAAKQRAKPKQAKPKKEKPNATHRPGRVRKINRKGCVFEVRGKLWTLVRTCAPKGTIVVPNGVTLDGKNRQLVVTGNAVKFDGAVVASGFGRANFRNLRILGNANLTGLCEDLSAGVLFYHSSGEIRNVTVRNTDLEPQGCFSGAGIMATGKKTVNILHSTVHNTGARTVNLQGTVNGTVAGNNLLISISGPTFSAWGLDLWNTTNLKVRDNDFRVGGPNQTTGISALRNSGLTVAGDRFHSLNIGIDIRSFPNSVLIRDNVMTGLLDVGMYVDGAVVQIRRNTITGVTPNVSDNGLDLESATSGAADNNTISNFACGVLDEGSSVTRSGNTFVNNTDDECFI